MGCLFLSRRGWKAEREKERERERESRLHFSPVQAGDLYLPSDDDGSDAFAKYRPHHESTREVA